MNASKNLTALTNAKTRRQLIHGIAVAFGGLAAASSVQGETQPTMTEAQSTGTEGLLTYLHQEIVFCLRKGRIGIVMLLHYKGRCATSGERIWRIVECWTMKSAVAFAIWGILACISCHAQSPKSPEGASDTSPKLEKMPEALENRFALSAIPSHLREAATTYVLEPAKGYVLSHKGTNGISCIVVRSDWQWPDSSFRDDIFWPVCYDAEGSKTLLQDYLYAAELRARDMGAKQVHAEVAKKIGTADYPNPSRSGVSYMLAPIMRGYTHGPIPATMNMPHYMFYAPNVKNTDIGGNSFGPYPFILSMSPGRDDYIILLVGKTEKAKILLDSKDLLMELCSYRDYLCTTDATRARTPVN
jgi:hypothetical protein